MEGRGTRGGGCQRVGREEGAATSCPAHTVGDHIFMAPTNTFHLRDRIFMAPTE